MTAPSLVLSANKAQEVVGERLDAKHRNPGRPPEYRFPWNGGHGLTHLRREVSLLFHSIDTLSALRRVSLNTPPRGVSTIGARSPFSNPSVTWLDSPACKPAGLLSGWAGTGPDVAGRELDQPAAVWSLMTLGDELDTPGMRELQLGELEAGLGSAFPEIEGLGGGQGREHRHA